MKLFNGDCLEVLKTLPDKSVDMVLTDPPYDVLHFEWDNALNFKAIFAELQRVLKHPNQVIVLFGVEPFSSKLRTLGNYRYDWYWQKSIVGGFLNAKKRPLKIIETISVFSTDAPIYYPQGLIECKRELTGGQNAKRQTDEHLYNGIGKQRTQEFTNYPTNLLLFPNDTDRGYHPTQKPVDLLCYLINTYTTEGQTVLDFTMGSGSTGVACVQTNRDFIGIELSPDYYKVAQERIANAKPIQQEDFLNYFQ